MKTSKKAVPVRVSKAKTSATALQLVPKVNGPVPSFADAIAASGFKAPTAAEATAWTQAEVEECYQSFVSGLKSTYGNTTRMARAIVIGSVSDVQVRDLWATHKEEDTAGKFLAALKEGLRTAQADAKGDLPKDAFTYNVNKTTGILARQVMTQRPERKASFRKMAEKAARAVVKATAGMTEEKAEQFRQNIASLFTSAVTDPTTFLAK